MAVYQFNVEIIPRSFLGEPAIESISVKQLQEGLSPWIDVEQPNEPFFCALRSLLPMNTSWGEVEEFASNDVFGSKLRIWWTDGRLDNVDFAYSPATTHWSVMQQFLGIVNSAGLLLVELERGMIIAPQEETLKPIFMQSRAMQFIADPKGTILRAAEELKGSP